MSSSKSWIVRFAGRRAGWTLVIAGAAFVAALMTGDSLVAAVIAILVVVALSAFIPYRGKRASVADYPGERSRGTAYAVSHTWAVDRKPDLAEIVRALGEKGLTLQREIESPDEVILKSGSQFWTRLFGGYFVDSRRLPITIHLKAEEGGPGSAWTVQLEIRDRLGVAVRDEALGERFAQAVGTIREAVDAQLGPIGGTGIDTADSATR